MMNGTVTPSNKRAAAHLMQARTQNKIKNAGFILMKEGVVGGKDCLGMKNE